MLDNNNYFQINKQSWNNRLQAHLASEFYDLESFKKGATSLNEIELLLLGNIEGKSILHLQCHFGQDSISLARMGANVTGVDLSDQSIAVAQELANELKVNARFICCNIYDLPQHLNEQFDYVFTSYGVLGWLPDLNAWAKLIHQFLKPNGKLVLAEFHPVVWMFDDNFTHVGYNYFNIGALVEQETGTYADRTAELNQSYINWNHGLGEVIQSLLTNNLSLKHIEEFNYSPYPCFKHTQKIGDRKFQIPHIEDKIPMVYALVAEKTIS